MARAKVHGMHILHFIGVQLQESTDIVMWSTIEVIHFFQVKSLVLGTTSPGQGTRRF